MAGGFKPVWEGPVIAAVVVMSFVVSTLLFITAVSLKRQRLLLWESLVRWGGVILVFRRIRAGTYVRQGHYEHRHCCNMYVCFLRPQHVMRTAPSVAVHAHWSHLKPAPPCPCLCHAARWIHRTPTFNL